jgi:hypothetical protein
MYHTFTNMLWSSNMCLLCPEFTLMTDTGQWELACGLPCKYILYAKHLGCTLTYGQEDHSIVRTRCPDVASEQVRVERGGELQFRRCPIGGTTGHLTENSRCNVVFLYEAWQVIVSNFQIKKYYRMFLKIVTACTRIFRSSREKLKLVLVGPKLSLLHRHFKCNFIYFPKAAYPRKAFVSNDKYKSYWNL